MVLHCKVLSSPRELRGPCLNPPSPFCHGGMWLMTVTIVIKLLLPGRAKTMFYNVSFAASLNFLVWSGLCFNWLSAMRRLLVDNRMWQHILNLRAFQWWLETRSLIVNHPALYYYTFNCTGYISDLYSINHFCKMALLSLYEEKWQSTKASLLIEICLMENCMYSVADM